MSTLNRRSFLKLGAASAGLAASGLAQGATLTGSVKLEAGGKDVSPGTGKVRKAIPSACWQCVTRDGIIGHVEDGRLVKIEGNPALPRTNGKLCARGQAGVNVIYNPDRLLHPLKRVGKRGEDRWQKVSWDEALDLLVNGGEVAGREVKGLKALRDEGHPERFMFHYGRMKGSDSKIVKSHFLAAYGTKTIGNHTSICEAAKWTAQELTWGSHYDNWDFENTRFILNFGSNVLECHTNHVPEAQRCIAALARGVPMYTFDVRLSNTAAKSTEWIPIKPGTDLAVVLAMCNVLIESDICDREFIETYSNVTVDELRTHLAQYTPQWAEEKSGVPAATIRRVALDYGASHPGVCISYRGAVMHYNGVQTERAILMLEAITGNIDCPGGRCRAVGAKWKSTYPTPKTEAAKLHLVDGEKGAYAFPTHHASHQVLNMIRNGPERPDIYMVYCYNPVYANGDVRANIDLMKDEEKMPFIVAVDVALSETSELADLVLPDATYLARWTVEDMVCPSQVREYYIRQPVVKPLGEARNFCDVVAGEIAPRLGIDLGFKTAEEFVRDCCENTPGVREAGGFDYMREHGAWYDQGAEPAYFNHAQAVDVAGATRDEATGVYYKKGPEDKDYSSLDSHHAAGQYVAQRCGDGVARRGFPPDKHRWKTGLLEIRSKALADKGFDALPSWMPIPEHEKMERDDLILTTFKVNVQTHSRTQSCKWLTEIYHENPAWLHPDTAAARGIRNGDLIKVTSSVGDVITRARVTDAVLPGAVAISHHMGHWAWGGYASSKPCGENYGHACEPDCQHKWWGKKARLNSPNVWRDGVGVHPNWIIPNAGDPIAGAMRWMDTVVKVTRA